MHALQTRPYASVDSCWASWIRVAEWWRDKWRILDFPPGRSSPADHGKITRKSRTRHQLASFFISGAAGESNRRLSYAGVRRGGNRALAKGQVTPLRSGARRAATSHPAPLHLPDHVRWLAPCRAPKGRPPGTGALLCAVQTPRMDMDRDVTGGKSWVRACTERGWLQTSGWKRGRRPRVYSMVALGDLLTWSKFHKVNWFHWKSTKAVYFCSTFTR